MDPLHFHVQIIHHLQHHPVVGYIATQYSRLREETLKKFISKERPLEIPVLIFTNFSVIGSKEGKLETEAVAKKMMGRGIQIVHIRNKKQNGALSFSVAHPPRPCFYLLKLRDGPELLVVVIWRRGSPCDGINEISANHCFFSQ